MFAPDEFLVPPEEKVLVAVSGGADSVALLVWLHQIRRELVVAHVNHDLHELRGGDCERDEKFVRELCARLGIPLRVARVELDRKNGHVHEAAARAARYAALLQMARAENCSLVATAHSATDALETALLNLGRGGGPRAFASLAPGRELGEGVRLVRPFWKSGREGIRAWLKSQNVAWREDESNQSALFRRNRVRHEVLPLLAQICGRETESWGVQFAANSQLAREEDAWMESAARRELATLILVREANLLVLDGLQLRNFHPALARRILRLAAREISPDSREIEAAKIEFALRAVRENERRAVWMWRSDLKVEWTGAHSGNRLRFARV